MSIQYKYLKRNDGSEAKLQVPCTFQIPFDALQTEAKRQISRQKYHIQTDWSAYGTGPNQRQNDKDFELRDVYEAKVFFYWTFKSNGRRRYSALKFEK